MGDRFYFLIFIFCMLLTTLIILQYSFGIGEFRTKCIDVGDIESQKVKNMFVLVQRQF